MFKKAIFVFLSIFSLQLFCITATVLADAASELEQADGYYESGDYQQAQTAYQNIVTTYPGTDYALKAQTGIAKVYLAVGDIADADAAIEKLKNDFSNHSGLPKAIDEVARKCRSSKVKRHSKAVELYQYNLNRWPTGEYAMESQKLIAKAGIEAGDFADVNEAVDKLLSDYSGDSDLVRAVYDLAECCYVFGEYQMAGQLYQKVLDNNPNAKYSMRSQRGLAISSIRLGEESAADAAVSKLLSDFEQNPELPTDACKVAFEYRRFRKYDKAVGLYQSVLAAQPTSEYAIWLNARTAKAHIESKNYTAVDTIIAKLLSDFSGNEDLAKALYEIGTYYATFRDDQRAKSVYQQIIQRFASYNYYVKGANMGIWAIDNVFSLMDSGDDESVQQAIETLIADFSDNPELAQIMFYTGHRYYEDSSKVGRSEGEALNDMQKAIDIWEKMKARLPADYLDDYIGDYYYFSATGYSRLGQYSKAIEHFEKICSEWPEFEYAWNAQFLVGRCYQRLAEAGTMSKSQAASKTKSAYETLLSRYPDCKAAGAAKRWLSKQVNAQ